MDLNKLSDYEKIAKIWQIELNMEYLNPKRNVRMSFKDIGPFCEYLAINYLPDYHGGGSGGMGFDLIKDDNTKAFEVKSCCTIQNSKCKNDKCSLKFNRLFADACPICSSTDFWDVDDSRFGIKAKETLDEISNGFFGGFIICHISKVDQIKEDTTLKLKAEWYLIDFGDTTIKDEQLNYFRNQANKGRQDTCNLLPNKFDFYKLCPLKIQDVTIEINYGDLNVTPKITENNVKEFPLVPEDILRKNEKEQFRKLASYNPNTKTADCKEFTLKIPYRNKSLGKDRGDTKSNKYKRMEKQSD